VFISLDNKTTFLVSANFSVLMRGTITDSRN